MNERSVYEEALSKNNENIYYPQLFMKYTDEEQNTMAMTKRISIILLITSGLYGLQEKLILMQNGILMYRVLKMQDLKKY